MSEIAFERFILVLPVLLFSIVAHEFAHGYAALKQGDDTALMLGRLTFNPIKHIDPFMTILFPIVMFIANGPILGAARPVPVNPRKYRRFKRGDIIVSLAGIATNLALAILATALVALVGLIPVVPSAREPQSLLQAMMAWGVVVNLSLAMFNLFPLPPLDGSHVLKYLLPPGWAFGFQRIGFFGFFLLLLLLNTGVIRWWMTPARIGTNALLGAAASVTTIFPHALAPWGDFR